MPVSETSGTWDGLLDCLRREAELHGGTLAAWVAGLRARTGELENGALGAPEGGAHAWVLACRACALLLVPSEAGAGEAAARAAGWCLQPRGGGAQALEAGFPPEDLALLSRLAEDGAPPAFRARVHDLAATLSGDEGARRAALEAYLECALRSDLERPQHAYAAGDALLRAAQLAQSLRAEARVEANFRELLPRVLESGPPATLQRLFQAATLLPDIHPVFLANLAITRAETELERGEHRWSRVFFSHAQAALRQAGRTADADTLTAVRAHVLAEESRALGRRGAPGWVRASLLSLALDELHAQGEVQDLARTFAGERARLLAERSGPDRAQDERGQLARLLEEVLRAFDQTSPVLRWRFLALLPIEPPADGAFAEGLEVLDDARRRFQARVREGRPPCWALDEATGATRVEAARVRAWTRSAHDWMAPLFDLLRWRAAGDGAANLMSLDHFLAGSLPEVAQRAPFFGLGLEACWEGDPATGIRTLVPELLRLRAVPRVRALLEASPSLALVDAALLDHPDGLRLRDLVVDERTAVEGLTQPAANLLMWWAACLVDQLGEVALQPLVASAG